MAKKRTEDDIMPSSPLAGKLAQTLNPNARRVAPAEPPPIEQASPPLAIKPEPVVEEPSVEETAATPAPEPPPAKARQEKRRSKKHQGGDAPRVARRTMKREETRVMLDKEEVAMRDRVIKELRDATDEKIEYSHLMRSLLSLAVSAIPAIQANARHAAVPPRPANNEYFAMAEFEDELAKYLLLALRDKKAMDAD